MNLKWFHMGELMEGDTYVRGVFNLVWYDTVTDDGFNLSTVLLIFAWERKATHYEPCSRDVRYGRWCHWVSLYREDRWPIPVVGLMKSKFLLERLA